MADKYKILYGYIPFLKETVIIDAEWTTEVATVEAEKVGGNI